MTPFRFPFVALSLAGVLTGCASEGSVTAGNDMRAGATNFSVSGSLLAGQTFTSFERNLTTRGYNVTRANKELGIVSVLNPISMGKGSRATLNAAVPDSQNRVRVDTTFAIPGLTSTSTSGVRDAFCAILRDAFSAT
jgi:hypothetical protein